MRRSRMMKAAVGAGVLALVTAGCLSEGGGDGGGTGGKQNTSKNVEIMTGFTGPQFNNFKASVDPYAKEQGITIKWAPTPDFNTLIRTRVRGNQLPDIALFPQPGIMRDIAKSGKMIDLGGVLDMSDVQTNMVTGALEAVKSDDGKQHAIIASMNVKSLVFYPKKAFEAAYQAPKTIDELLALSEKIKSEGKTPWCIGIESGAATGWPATDWIEQLVLNYGGLDQYNDWVAHKIPFNSPLVKQASDTFAKIAFTPGYVAGGRKSIASANFNTAANPMFSNPPGCFMYRQGNFVAQAGGFPANVIADLDNIVGVFAFPPADAGTTPPVLGGGDLAGLFSNSDAAKTIIKYMSSKNFGGAAAKGGTYLSPRKDFDPSNYPNKLTQEIAKIGYNASAFAFDGSDQMPGEVGSGTFWRQMTQWISGATSLDSALKGIDKSWPSS